MTDTCYCGQCEEDKDVVSRHVNNTGVETYTLECTHTMMFRLQIELPYVEPE